MNKLKTNRASNHSPSPNLYDQLNKSTELPTKKGQKLQSTVRFESATYAEVEQVQQTLGTSFAETVRKLVSEGLTSFEERRTSSAVREIEDLLSRINNEELREAFIKTQNALMQRKEEIP